MPAFSVLEVFCPVAASPQEDAAGQPGTVTESSEDGFPEYSTRSPDNGLYPIYPFRFL